MPDVFQQLATSSSMEKALGDIATPTPTINKPIVEELEVIEETKPTIATAIKEKIEQLPEMDDVLVETETDFLIFAFDFIQKSVFEFLANRAVKKRADQICGGNNTAEKIKATVTKLKENRARIKANQTPVELTEQEQLLAQLKTELEEFTKELDLDEKETKFLQNSLKQIIKVRNKPLSPELKLLITAALIFTPRILGLRSL